MEFPSRHKSIQAISNTSHFSVPPEGHIIPIWSHMHLMTRCRTKIPSLFSILSLKPKPVLNKWMFLLLVVSSLILHFTVFPFELSSAQFSTDFVKFSSFLEVIVVVQTLSVLTHYLPDPFNLHFKRLDSKSRGRPSILDHTGKFTPRS